MVGWGVGREEGAAAGGPLFLPPPLLPQYLLVLCLAAGLVEHGTLKADDKTVQ